MKLKSFRWDMGSLKSAKREIKLPQVLPLGYIFLKISILTMDYHNTFGDKILNASASKIQKNLFFLFSLHHTTC